MRTIILLFALLLASPAWAVGPMELLMAARDGRDVYTFTTNPSPTWTLGPGAVWDDANNSVDLAGGTTSGTFTHSTLAHAAGYITVEYYRSCEGGSCDYYEGPLVYSVDFDNGFHDDGWHEVTIYVSGGSSLTINYTTVDTDDLVMIRKVTVPKP